MIATLDSHSLTAGSVTQGRFHEDLSGCYALTEEMKHFFRENGFIKLKHVLSRDTLTAYAQEISRQVQRLNKQRKPLEKRDLYGRAFLQVMNLWTHSEVVKELVFSRKLARIASELMGVSGVRLYHDQALYKEPGGGITPWHADQFYWPLDTAHTVTAWIPLQDTPLEMGSLAFAPKSHNLHIGRNVAISAESEAMIGKTLRDLQMKIVEEPYDLGEISFHLGWNWHRAGANTTRQPRRVLTVIYMEEQARLHAPRHKNHQQDWDTWMPGAKVGQVVNTPLNPILWSEQLATEKPWDSTL
jgi:ectoine hydroxylase-related dioxygenase (phytanoyl-CoA dioxygenase family)